MSENPTPPFTCPLCGKEIAWDGTTHGIPFHICEESSSIPATAKPGQGEAIPRRFSICPKCHISINVSAYNPLDKVQCHACAAHFELLKSFGDFTLLKSYDAGWQNAVYLAEKPGTSTLAIIKVLSSKILDQPHAIGEFLKETEAARSKTPVWSIKKFSLIRKFVSGEIQGFQYFAAIFGAYHTTPLKILDILGIDLRPGAIQAEKMNRTRSVECTRCHQEINVAQHDPLDDIHCPSCSSRFELHRNLADYRIDYRLNSGGTSILYLAQHRRTGRKVALKVLSAAEMVRNPLSIDSFLREIGLVEQLIHSTIVKVFEGGEFEGFYWMAMELVDGLALSEILATIQGENKKNQTDGSKRSLPELLCLEIVIQVANSLETAHEKGLVHSDLKPDNIMLTYDGWVKVLDFGLFRFANIQKLLERGTEDPIFGTPLYIPPERIRGQPEDLRSDIYSLGASLFHLLCGNAPFWAKTSEEVLAMHIKKPLVDFKTIAPWVSDATCRIVDRCMKKAPESRYSTTKELIADLSSARQLLVQRQGTKLKSSQAIIKGFMKSMPKRSKPFSFWRRATTKAVHVYRFVTMAITNRFRKN